MAAYETREAVEKLGERDPEVVELVSSGKPYGWKALGLPSNSLEENATLLASQAPPTAPDTPTESWLTIPLSAGHSVQARVYKPRPAPEGAPLVVFLHGGGFLIGNPLMVAAHARAVAAGTGAVVVAPTYRFAPAHPFPAAQEDTWDAVNWLAQSANVAPLGVDLGKGFIVGGESAGANLAATAAQRYVARGPGGGAALTGVLLVVPYVLEAAIVPAEYRELWISREQSADALMIDSRAIAYVKRQSLFDHSSPLFSPFNVPGAHKGMPPVYIHVAGEDPLRDDGLVYERVLRAHGVKTRLDVYPGVPHAHWDAMPTLAASQKARVDFVKAVGWLLGQDVSDEDAEKAVAAAHAPVTSAA